MKNLKLIKITLEELHFDNNVILLSEHNQDCCEQHYLDLNDLTLEDFEGLRFDLSGDDFFNRIEGYGIELIPIRGHSVKIPGHGDNSGYYSSNLSLIITVDGKEYKSFDITECQVY